MSSSTSPEVKAGDSAPKNIGHAQPLPPKPGDPPAYYVCIFGYETTPRTPQTSHTFATFIKADAQAFEAHTISWLPQTNAVRLIRASAETGVNHDLKSTLDIARAAGAKIQHWGPFEIQRELYDRALQQIDKLNSGRVLFKAIDLGERPDDATNCIHAVSDVDVDHGKLTTGTSYGFDASAKVVQHLARWFINPDVKHTWVSAKLGLEPNNTAAE